MSEKKTPAKSDGKKTVVEVLEEVCAEICNKYCKYPDMPVPEGKTEDWLLEEGGPCDTCPMNRIQ